MIEVKTGNALNLTEGIFVHGCNCLGVMGAGIAKGVKSTWPSAFNAYKSRYDNFGLQLGDTVIVGSREAAMMSSGAARHMHSVDENMRGKLVIVNAMTQEITGNDPNTVYVDYGAVFAAFSRVRMLARDTGLTVNFPLIGCGLANGSWTEVEKAITMAMGSKYKLVLWKLPE